MGSRPFFVSFGLARQRVYPFTFYPIIGDSTRSAGVFDLFYAEYPRVPVSSPGTYTTIYTGQPSTLPCLNNAYIVLYTVRGNPDAPHRGFVPGTISHAAFLASSGYSSTSGSLLTSKRKCCNFRLHQPQLPVLSILCVFPTQVWFILFALSDRHRFLVFFFPSLQTTTAIIYTVAIHIRELYQLRCVVLRTFCRE